MGNQSAKPSSKDTRTTNSRNRTQAIAQTKQNVQALQQQAIAQVAQVQSWGQTQTGGSQLAFKQQTEAITQAIHIAETAKRQLDREGAPLTKADLVAIVIALKPSNAQHMKTIQEHTVQDLNALIRTLVYDPKRYLPTAETAETAAPIINNTNKKQLTHATETAIVPVKKSAIIPASATTNLFAL